MTNVILLPYGDAHAIDRAVTTVALPTLVVLVVVDLLMCVEVIPFAKAAMIATIVTAIIGYTFLPPYYYFRDERSLDRYITYLWIAVPGGVLGSLESVRLAKYVFAVIIASFVILAYREFLAPRILIVEDVVNAEIVQDAPKHSDARRMRRKHKKNKR
jgi:hypothetical protein